MVLSTAKVLGLLGGHCCLFLFVGPLRVCCIKHFRWRFFDPAKVLVEALFFSLLLLLLLVFRVRSFGPEVQLMGVSNGFDQLLFFFVVRTLYPVHLRVGRENGAGRKA